MVTREDIVVYEEDINSLVNDIFNGEFMNQYSDVVGSFTADIVRAFATELLVQQNLYSELSNNYNPETAEGIYLDSICQEDYIFRNKAIASNGKVRIYGKSGTLIETGMVVESQNCTYTITEDKIVAYSDTGDVGFSDVSIIANISGKVGNCGAGEINKFNETYAGLEKVENLTVISNGIDEESDKELRARRKKLLSTPSVNYNSKMLEEMILKKFENVKKVKIIPRFGSKGNVKIVTVGNEYNALESEKIQNIIDFLDSEIITDATFTVTTIQKNAINVDLMATIFEEYTEKSTKEIVKTELNKVFLENLFNGNTLFYADIVDNLVEIEAFKNIYDVKINGAKENIILADEDFATVGTINLTIQS